MRYAVTFTTDETWNTVDTFILESDTNPIDMNEERLTKMFEAYITDSIVASNLASDYKGYWFCRNLGDTDVNMVGQ